MREAVTMFGAFNSPVMRDKIHIMHCGGANVTLRECSQTRRRLQRVTAFEHAIKTEICI